MYISGINSVYEYLNSNQLPDCVYITRLFNNSKILDLLSNLKINYTSKESLNSLVGHEKHQGIVIKIKEFKYHDLSDIINSNTERGLVLLLDGIEDPHNFGAVLRVAEATGVSHIIINKANSVSVNETVYKTSAGAVNYLKIIRYNIAQAIDILKKNGYWVYGLENRDDAKIYSTVDYDLKTAVVLGSEGFGISSLVSKKLDFVIKLPMLGKVTSLNASTACSAILYHIISSIK